MYRRKVEERPMFEKFSVVSLIFNSRNKPAALRGNGQKMPYLCGDIVDNRLLVSYG
jgi:hypothetical protein